MGGSLGLPRDLPVYMLYALADVIVFVLIKRTFSLFQLVIYTCYLLLSLPLIKFILKVYYFFFQPNSIILAISPANQDIATSDAMKLAREVDPTGMS